jgi:hypothetical protein
MSSFESSSMASFGSPVLSMIGVTIGPGATVLTRMLRPASSAAGVRAKERSVALLAEYALVPCGTCLARNAGIQNDRRAVIQQWQGFLDGEVRSHHVEVETLVVRAFRSLGKWGKLRHSRVYEPDIDFAQFLRDFRVQLVYVREFGHVPLHRHDAVADGFDRFVQGFSASAQDGYPRAFFLQALGRG